jgi:hypothetical protein
MPPFMYGGWPTGPGGVSIGLLYAVRSFLVLRFGHNDASCPGWYYLFHFGCDVWGSLVLHPLQNCPVALLSMLQFVHYQFTQIIMPKVTLTNADSSTTDFFPQSYTDAAVAAAINGVPANPVIEPSVTEVDLVLTDGSSKKFVAA